MMGRKRNERFRTIKAGSSPKDLAYSTAWFIGCFLNNVTRLRHDLKLVEAHPVNMESMPELQRLMFNWRSENGTAGCYIQFLESGAASIHQWFGTDPLLKKQIESIWEGCIKQLDDAWKAHRTKQAFGGYIK